MNDELRDTVARYLAAKSVVRRPQDFLLQALAIRCVRDADGLNIQDASRERMEAEVVDALRNDDELWAKVATYAAGSPQGVSAEPQPEPEPMPKHRPDPKRLPAPIPPDITPDEADRAWAAYLDRWRSAPDAIPDFTAIAFQILGSEASADLRIALSRYVRQCAQGIPQDLGAEQRKERGPVVRYTHLPDKIDPEEAVVPAWRRMGKKKQSWPHNPPTWASWCVLILLGVLVFVLTLLLLRAIASN